MRRGKNIERHACRAGRAHRCRARWLIGLALLNLPLIARAIPEPPRKPTLLVGVMVRQQEVGTLEVQTDGEHYLVPLEPFAELTGCTVEYPARGIAKLNTPLGAVALYNNEDLQESHGTVYILQEALERKLATPVWFDRSRYAIGFDVPWSIPRDGHSDREFEALEPDVTAPGATLSTLRSDLRYDRLDDDGFFGSTSTLGGKLGAGYWRMRYDDNLAGRQTVQDYAWLYKQGNRLFLAGNQRVRVHPLLRSLEFTGAQVGWTNQSLELFSRNQAPRELLSRRMQPTRTFEGYGPPAGRAELRINGTLIERRAIGLDGRYEFIDVAIPARPDSRIEVLLYDRHNPQVPVEVHEEMPTASAFLLPEGARILMGGAGGAGNFVQDRIDSRQRSGFAGFYQTRYGHTDRVTFEAAVQTADDVTQFLGGMVTRLSPSFVMSLGLGASNRAAGYSVDVEGLRRPWRLLLRALGTQPGFDPYYDVNRYDHFVEFGRGIGPGLDVALIGRSRKNALDDVDYVLPALSWRATSDLSLRGRPDYDGNYRFELNYRLRPWTRLSASTVNSRGYVQLAHQFNRNYHLTADTEFGDNRPSRQSVILSASGSRRWRASWMAGALVNAGEPGYLVGGRIELLPGVFARAQYESEARLNAPGTPQQTRLLLNLAADLGYSRGRFVAARTTAVRSDRGGVAGKVRIDAPPGFPSLPLGDLPILIDGRRVGRTVENGSFFIGELKPGIYRLELDPENLPIELTPQIAAVNAQVAGAAVTRLEFVVRPEFGLAGRVRDAGGSPQSGLTLELVAPDGSVLQSATTDRFGLFRIDGVPIGIYVLRPADAGLPDAVVVVPSRTVEIRDDFLFGQDIELPFVVELPGADPNGN